MSEGGPASPPGITVKIEGVEGPPAPTTFSVSPGDTVAKIRAKARKHAAAPGGAWRVYLDGKEMVAAEQVQLGSSITVAPGLVPEGLVRDIPVGPEAPVDLAQATEPFKMVKSRKEDRTILRGDPKLVYNPMTNQEFLLAIYRSGDAMHDPLIDTDPFLQADEREKDASEQDYQSHLALYSSVFHLANTYPSNTGAPRKFWLINLDGRERGQAWGASARADFEIDALNDVHTALKEYGGYDTNPWPKPECIFEPIWDFTVGTAEAHRRVTRIAETWGENDLVVMHCSASFGRTGGVVMSILAALNAHRLEPGLSVEELEATKSLVKTATRKLYANGNDELSTHRATHAVADAVYLRGVSSLPYFVPPARWQNRPRTPIPIHAGRPDGKDRGWALKEERENMEKAMKYTEFGRLAMGEPKEQRLAWFIIRVVSNAPCSGTILAPDGASGDCAVGSIPYDQSWVETGEGHPKMPNQLEGLLSTPWVRAIAYPLGLLPQDLQHIIRQYWWDTATREVTWDAPGTGGGGEPARSPRIPEDIFGSDSDSSIDGGSDSGAPRGKRRKVGSPGSSSGDEN